MTRAERIEKAARALVESDGKIFGGHTFGPSWVKMRREPYDALRTALASPSPATAEPTREGEPGEPCPAAGMGAETGTCFACDAKVDPTPCFCGKAHTGVYCWPCHHKNARSCAAPHCPDHGYLASQRWLAENDDAGRSPASGGEGTT